jgi:hypothetical protein
MVNFNISDEDRKQADSQSYDELPAGIYPAMLEQVRLKQSQAGHNYVSVTLGIIDGDFKGRKYFENLNLFHPEKKTRDIAVSKLRLFEKAFDTILGTEEEFVKYIGSSLTFELEQSKKGNTYLKNIVKGGASISTAPSVSKPNKATVVSVADDNVPF